MTDMPLPLPTSHSLGSDGPAIGPLAYGCWRLAGRGALSAQITSAQEKVETALAQGMNLIDTADIYGSSWPGGFGEAEDLLGLVLERTPSLRRQMILATKAGIVPGLPYSSQKDYLIKACEASLSRLKTDVIDLYQIHRPDLLSHPADVAGALSELHRAGKIRYVGVSNYTPAQTRALQAHLDFPIVSQQPEISATRVDALFDGTLDWCMETGAVALAWSPLAGGDLMLDPASAGTLAPLISVLDLLAEKHACDRSAIALAFLMCHPAGVVPIIGTQTPGRIVDAAKAKEVQLSRRDWYDILEATLGKPMP